MRPFTVVVDYVLRDDLSEVPLSEGHQAVQALLLDRADEALCVRAGVRGAERRLDDLEPGLAEVSAARLPPLRIAITDQHTVAMRGPSSAKTSVRAICCMKRALSS